MGGVNVDTGKGSGRRSVDSEINLIPMIDLLIVTLSFLLITAVWSRMARLNANAQVPGPPQVAEKDEVPPEKMLTVEMRQDNRFMLIWKSGGTVHNTLEVERKPVELKPGEVRYPDLATEIAKQWNEYGSHKGDNDTKLDQAIISVDNRAPFSEVVAVIDAIYQVKRPMKGGEINAFNVTFSAR